MKISQETLAILSNFAAINQNIFIAAGNVIKTKTPASLSVIATAHIQETFPVDFSVYELSKFLNVLSLFEDPDVEFHEGHMTVAKNKAQANFVYTNPSLIDAVKDYDKEIKSPEPVIEFTLGEDVFKRIQKSAKLFDVSDINISSAGQDNIRITATGAAMSKENANKFTVDVPAPDKWADDISINIKLETLKFLPGDYDVSIAIMTNGSRSLAICKFKNITFVDSQIEYIVAAEAM